MQAELGFPKNTTDIPVFCKEHKEEGIEIFKDKGWAGINHGVKRKTLNSIATTPPQ